MSPPVEPGAVLAFWRAAGPTRWFTKSAAFDAEITSRFLTTYETATAGLLDWWAASRDGMLALIIMFDQFPRNMFRHQARAFATDPLARAVADRAIAHAIDRQFTLPERQFFYLPLTHAENLADQRRCVVLSREAGDAVNLRYAEIHADIIARFGRFPHRNAVLGRLTTRAERAFLDGGGFSG